MLFAGLSPPQNLSGGSASASGQLGLAVHAIHRRADQALHCPRQSVGLGKPMADNCASKEIKGEYKDPGKVARA